MNSDFAVAELPPQLLSEIKQLEERLRADANRNIVLIAYTEKPDSDNQY